MKQNDMTVANVPHAVGACCILHDICSEERLVGVAVYKAYNVKML